MRTLLELLSGVDGSDTIRQCWGHVPPFAYGQILHVKRTADLDGGDGLLMTVVLITSESGNANECKPSKLVVEFGGVLYWEYDAYAEANGIRPDDVLTLPPPGTMAVNVEYSFYVVCRSVRVLSCIHDPFDTAGE
jgi:hypothetical protein